MTRTNCNADAGASAATAVRVPPYAEDELCKLAEVVI